MRRAACIGALLCLAGCKLPPAPDGYQFTCASDSECLDGTVCAMNCCVKPGEQPTCVAAVGYGTGCSGGPTSGGSTTDLTGSCPASFTCYSEATFGFVGGFCSTVCSSAAGQECLPGEVDCLQGLCVRRCQVRTGGFADCRPGWSCECGGGDAECHCLSKCAASGKGSCSTAPDGTAMRCDTSSGLCVPAPGSDAGLEAVDAGSGGADSGVDAGVPLARDAGPSDAAGFDWDASAWWSPPIANAVSSTSCSNFCASHSAACDESCIASDAGVGCGAASGSGASWTEASCGTDWSTQPDAGYFRCCCEAYATWSACTGQTDQVGSCTQYCASQGKPCADTCRRGAVLGGALTGAPQCYSGGKMQTFSCNYAWGDAVGSPARWTCCCL